MGSSEPVGMALDRSALGRDLVVELIDRCPQYAGLISAFLTWTETGREVLAGYDGTEESAEAAARKFLEFMRQEAAES